MFLSHVLSVSPPHLSILFATRALETNKYNHITATYFLLAERILREKQEKEVQPRSSSPSNIKAHFRYFMGVTPSLLSVISPLVF